MPGGRYRPTQNYSAGGSTGTVWMPTRCGCTLAPPGEYDRTVRVRQRCARMSNYFDHLLLCFERQSLNKLILTKGSVSGYVAEPRLTLEKKAD